MLKIGILGLQGSVAEHVKMLNYFPEINPVVVKTKKDINTINALIIPGGESTTIGKLLIDFDLMDTLKKKIHDGMPVWGTCAGMILLAKKICNYDKTFLGAMDIEVRKNAYGSQLESFSTSLSIPYISNTKIPLVFIRAPYVEKVGPGVKILATLDDNIIACRQNNMVATSFHPELTENISFHKYFIENVVKK